MGSECIASCTSFGAGLNWSQGRCRPRTICSGRPRGGKVGGVGGSGSVRVVGEEGDGAFIVDRAGEG
jgi:hypothetical protein